MQDLLTHSLIHHFEIIKFKEAAGDKWNVAINTLPDDKILDWSKFKQFAKCIKKKSQVGLKMYEKRRNC